MSDKEMDSDHTMALDRENFQNLFDALNQKGYRTCAPTLKDNAVVYDEISSVDELPIGWSDDQDAGRYRLVKTKRKALFDYVVGFDSWKKFLYPPSVKILEARRNGQQFEINHEDREVRNQAFIGVRPCELHAIAILDKVLIEGPYSDPVYARSRQNLFIVAVNCTRPGGTCFCASMGTGPKADSGFDLALTEIIGKDSHYFVMEVGSEAGADLIKDIPCRPAGEDEIELAGKSLEKAEKSMGRSMAGGDIKGILQDNFDHPHWEEVARRCLTCGCCTMVCPTCFCSTVKDVTDLGGRTAQRWRKMDSCFSIEFSYIYGGSVRSSPKSRYRQWMTHKLASWIDQFGTSGCVGCGRCITWCPVGIDITKEAKAIMENK